MEKLGLCCQADHPIAATDHRCVWQWSESQLMKLVRGVTWPRNKAVTLPACFSVTVVWEMGDAEHKTRVLTAISWFQGRWLVRSVKEMMNAKRTQSVTKEIGAVSISVVFIEQFVSKLTVVFTSHSCGIVMQSGRLQWQWVWGGKKQVENRLCCTNNTSVCVGYLIWKPHISSNHPRGSG